MIRVTARHNDSHGANVALLRGSDGIWERFMSAEYRSLFARQRGQLRLALGAPLPEESKDEIEWMAREDQRRAEEGIVELKGKNGLYYKPLADLTSRDMLDRRAAETNRCEWLMGRMDERMRLIREDWDEAI